MPAPSRRAKRPGSTPAPDTEIARPPRACTKSRSASVNTMVASQLGSMREKIGLFAHPRSMCRSGTATRGVRLRYRDGHAQYDIPKCQFTDVITSASSARQREDETESTRQSQRPEILAVVPGQAAPSPRLLRPPSRQFVNPGARRAEASHPHAVQRFPPRKPGASARHEVEHRCAIRRENGDVVPAFDEALGDRLQHALRPADQWSIGRRHVHDAQRTRLA